MVGNGIAAADLRVFICKMGIMTSPFQGSQSHGEGYEGPGAQAAAGLGWAGLLDD